MSLFLFTRRGGSSSLSHWEHWEQWWPEGGGWSMPKHTRADSFRKRSCKWMQHTPHRLILWRLLKTQKHLSRAQHTVLRCAGCAWVRFGGSCTSAFCFSLRKTLKSLGFSFFLVDGENTYFLDYIRLNFSVAFKPKKSSWGRYLVEATPAQTAKV